MAGSIPARQTRATAHASPITAVRIPLPEAEHATGRWIEVTPVRPVILLRRTAESMHRDREAVVRCPTDQAKRWFTFAHPAVGGTFRRNERCDGERRRRSREEGEGNRDERQKLQASTIASIESATSRAR